jgi:hypothetical protein
MMNVDQARELVEDATAPGASEAARTRFEAEWPMVVALGSGDPAVRASLAHLVPALRQRQEDLEGAEWVALLLSVLHDEPFVAIDVPAHAGITGRMSGVADNFQLHTLLMDAMPAPRGLLRRRRPRVSAAAVDIARGEGPQELDETVTGAWNLYTYEALRDGRLPETDSLDTEHWIWNEGTPADIPILDGHRVMLLGPPAYVRTWNAARAFPDLPATLDHRTLESDEVEAWLRRMQQSRAG